MQGVRVANDWHNHVHQEDKGNALAMLLSRPPACKLQAPSSIAQCDQQLGTSSLQVLARGTNKHRKGDHMHEMDAMIMRSRLAY
jgi:hypothetical protein